jgi:two-component system OmpR family sensor kinase
MRNRPLGPRPGDEAPEGPPEQDEPRPPRPGRFRPGAPDPSGDFQRMPRPFTLLPRHEGLVDQTSSNEFYYVVWFRDGQELARSTNAPSLSRPAGIPGQGAGPYLRGNFREIFHTTPVGEIVLVGRSVTRELHDLKATAGWLALTGTVILALGLLGGWWISSRAIRPINAISVAAMRIADGDLSQRIDVADTDTELGRLAAVLNSTFTRLEAAFNRQKQFTSDAAHELRTPVSVIITQAQSTLNRERPAAEYRETIEACLRAAQRMRRLIESSLELARLDAGQEVMKRETFDLATVARECIGGLRPVAEERRITIVPQLTPAECIGDADRIAQVAANLLSNAIQYGYEKSDIVVASGKQDGSAWISVTDNGEGIPPEELPHIFERFYRVEKSRQAGRTGLGLAISKALVEAQGGTIEVTSQPGKGSQFVIRLPGSSS